MIPKTIFAELTEKEIHEIDLRLAGETILQETLSLSHEINTTLLEPMLPWLDDPDFMKKHQVIENDLPNWSEYKRKQREWTKQQKELAAQRLKAYWQEIRRKRNLRKELATLLNDRQQSIDNTEYDSESDQEPSKAFQELISTLSPASSRQIETDQEFNLTDQIPEPNRLPLRFILTDHISTSQDQATLNSLPQITNNHRLETVAKLQTLLQMEKEGVISLSQSEPFGELFLSNKLYPPKRGVPEGSPNLLIIKDRTGEESTWTWTDLSNDQKDKIIADTQKNRIIVRCA